MQQIGLCPLWCLFKVLNMTLLFELLGPNYTKAYIQNRTSRTVFIYIFNMEFWLFVSVGLKKKTPLIVCSNKRNMCIHIWFFPSNHFFRYANICDFIFPSYWLCYGDGFCIAKQFFPSAVNCLASGFLFWWAAN